VGKVITRFPPEPSGFLHIGHAKAALLNSYYAREYGGELILRFDDTNPAKEKDEFVDSITEDLHTLGISFDKLTWTSNYFDQIISYGREMIEKGLAYVDDTPVDQMRDERMKGIESRARSNSVEENLSLYQHMIDGTSTGLKCCVRAKIDMSAANKCMRDPTIFRCKVDAPHHRTGDKYKIYPTYDFACPIVDAIENVSHALRTIEYRDRNPQYHWFLSALNLRHVEVLEYSRLNFAFTLMSKRKLQWFVDQGLVEGWHDPRFPTVQGILRRGMTVEAIREFMRLQGFSKNVNIMEWDKIWAINKKIIDPTAHRYTALAYSDEKQQPLVPIHLTSTHNDLPQQLEYLTVQLHPKHPDIGNKEVARYKTIYMEQIDAASFADSEEITLMSWGNAIINKIHKDGDLVKSIDATLNLAGDVKKTDKKVHWIAWDENTEKDISHLKLVDFDHLITVPKIEEDQSVQDVINPNSRIESTGRGEHALKSGIRVGQIIQLNRKGFYYVDVVGQGSIESPIVLHSIPDGRLKEGTLEWNKWSQQQKQQAAVAAAGGGKEKSKKSVKNAEKK
jgi:glutamyl-tRNA synthetase